MSMTAAPAPKGARIAQTCTCENEMLTCPLHGRPVTGTLTTTAPKGAAPHDCWRDHNLDRGDDIFCGTCKRQLPRLAKLCPRTGEPCVRSSCAGTECPKGAADNSVRHDPPEVLPWDRPLVEQLRALVPPGKEIRYRWEELALQAADTIAALRADAVPREPTEAMKHAGYVAQLDSSYEYDELCAEIWRAMYDAAIKSQREGGDK